MSKLTKVQKRVLLFGYCRNSKHWDGATHATLYSLKEQGFLTREGIGGWYFSQQGMDFCEGFVQGYAAALSISKPKAKKAILGAL